MDQTPGEEQHARWRLVVAVDGSEGSREALLWTARLARVMKAKVVAIHTVERPEYAVAYVPWAWGPSLGDWDEQWQEWVDRVRGSSSIRGADRFEMPASTIGPSCSRAGPMTCCPTSGRWEATSWSSGAGGSAASANSSLAASASG